MSCPALWPKRVQRSCCGGHGAGRWHCEAARLLFGRGAVLAAWLARMLSCLDASRLPRWAAPHRERSPHDQAPRPTADTSSPVLGEVARRHTQCWEPACAWHQLQQVAAFQLSPQLPTQGARATARTRVADFHAVRGADGRRCSGGPNRKAPRFMRTGEAAPNIVPLLQGGGRSRTVVGHPPEARFR